MVIHTKKIIHIIPILYNILILYSNHHLLISSKIIIPFGHYDSSPDSFIINYSDNFIYTEIQAGSYSSYPNGKKLGIFLSLKSNCFEITQRDICPSSSFYDKNNSLSYKYYSDFSHDNFYFSEEVKEIPFTYKEKYTSENKFFCGDLGFRFIKTNMCKEEENLMLNLKKDKYITSYDVSFKFNEYKEYDNYDNLKGEVIIGELPDIYDSDNYFSEQYNTDYTYGGKNSIMYQLNFDKVYAMQKSQIQILQNKDNKEDIIIAFEINYGLISGPGVYQNYIENNFFNKSDIKNLCIKKKEERNALDYDIYICEENIKSKFDLFPELKFYYQKFDYNFTFNSKDLFMKKNNKYYFKVTFLGKGYKQWRFGLPFFMKYRLVFNQDTLTIGFYNDNIKHNNDNNGSYNLLTKFWFWIIIILILFGLIFGSIFIYKKFFGNNRRKKANELDDEFDYEAKRDKADNLKSNENNDKNKLFENENEYK